LLVRAYLEKDIPYNVACSVEEGSFGELPILNRLSTENDELKHKGRKRMISKLLKQTN